MQASLSVGGGFYGWVAVQVSLSIACSKQIVNTKLIGEKFEGSPLELGTRQNYSFSAYLLLIVFEVLGRAVRQLKEIKGIKTGKGEVKMHYLQMIL